MSNEPSQRVEVSEPPTAEHSAAAMPDVREIVAAVDAYLGEYVAGLELAETLREAIRYSLLGGGKRVRPVLAWMSAEAVGGAGRASLPAGAAVEMVHAFSLVHDDLPAMDDDDLRRGRPTLHKHAGEAMAILAGDAMLALAFAALDGGEPDAGVANELREELVRGAVGMINGQVYDTLGGFGGSLTDVERLELIHRNKTGALIRASCRMGGLLGGADPAQLEAVTRFGEVVGLQFQVLDDLLDVVGTSEAVGKATGKDVEAGKLTYPGVVGVDESRRVAGELLEQALAAVGELGEGADGLRDLARYLAARSA